MSLHPLPNRTTPYSVHRPARNMGAAIRQFCLECQGSYVETDVDGRVLTNHREVAGVRDCPSEHTCSLWRYRFGKDPARKGGPGNPEALKAFRQVGRKQNVPESHEDARRIG